VQSGVTYFGDAVADVFEALLFLACVRTRTHGSGTAPGTVPFRNMLPMLLGSPVKFPNVLLRDVIEAAKMCF
jgi:hypothetical protein